MECVVVVVEGPHARSKSSACEGGCRDVSTRSPSPSRGTSVSHGQQGCDKRGPRGDQDIQSGLQQRRTATTAFRRRWAHGVRQEHTVPHARKTFGRCLGEPRRVQPSGEGCKACLSLRDQKGGRRQENPSANCGQDKHYASTSSGDLGGDALRGQRGGKSASCCPLGLRFMSSMADLPPPFNYTSLSKTKLLDMTGDAAKVVDPMLDSDGDDDLGDCDADGYRSA